MTPNPHHSPDHKCTTHHAGTQSDCKKGLEEYDKHTSAKNEGKYTRQCAELVGIHPIPNIDTVTPSQKIQQLQDVLASSRRTT